jgi:type I restriction enzyme S subunit
MIMIYPSEITKKWPHRPLSEVVDFLDSKRKPITQKDRVPGPYPYYGANGQQDSVADYIFDEPLVLLAEDGGHFGDADKTIAYQVEGKCWVNNHAHVLRPKKDVDIRYICRHLERYDVTPFITGSTRGKLTKTAANNIPIALPPLEEQRRIAAILDKADRVRRKRKEAIRLTEELLKSTFLEMFGDPENSVYPVKTLNDVCSKITDGAHFTPTYTSTGVPFLRVTDIQNDFIDWENVKHIPIEEHKELIKRCHPKRGDILYSKNGTIGIPKIIDWDNDFSIFVSLALLSPKKEIILSDFLESFLRTPFALRQALSHTKTGTVSNLHLVEIRKVKLPVPDIHIQEQWILYKSEIHKMRNQLSGAFDESENLFNSLLQRAFRGEL